MSTSHRLAFSAALLGILGAAGVLGASLIADGNNTSDPAQFTKNPTYAQTISTGAGVVATVTSGNTPATEQHAREEDLSVPTSLRRVQLSGTLTDGTGKFIENARVYAIPISHDVVDAVQSSVGISAEQLLGMGISAETDNNGAFMIDGVAGDTDDYIVTAIAKEISPIYTKVLNHDSNIRLQGSSGHKVIGQVDDSTGSPIRGATIVAIHPRMSAGAPSTIDALIGYSTFRQTCESNEVGHFEITGTDEGPFTLMVMAPGFATCKILNVAADSGTLKFILPSSASISGKIMDVNQRPIAGAAIAVARILPNNSEISEGDDVVTDAKGIFTINAAPAGGCALLLKVVADGFASQEARLDPLQEKEHRSQDFILEPATDIIVKAVDANQSAISKANIEVYDATTKAFVAAGVSDESGRATIHGTSRDRRYRIFGEADGFALGWITDATPKQQNVLQLHRTITLSGRVVGENDVPIVGAKVQVRIEGDRDEDAELRESIFTKADGLFAVNDLTQGTVTLTVQANGFSSHRLSPLIIKNGIKPIEIKLKTGQKWQGQVVDSNGNPVSNVRVAVAELGSSTTRIRGTLGAGTTTGNDGLFELENVTPRTSQLVLSKNGHSVRAVSIPPAKDENSFRNIGPIVWTAGGTIEGIARHSDGTPIQGMRIQLLTTDIVGRMAPFISTSADGHFTFHDVQPGHHAVDFIDPNPHFMTGGFRRISKDAIVAENATTHLTLDFKLISKLQGRVRVRGQIPGNDVEVVVRALNSFAPERGSCIPDWSGNYELLVPEPGTLSVEVRSIRGPAIRTSRIITLNEGETRTLDLEIGEGSISGNVISTNDQTAVPNARITLSDSRGSRWFVTTNENGDFQISGLPLTTFTAFAQAPGYASGPITTIELASKHTANVSLGLFEGATLITSVDSGFNSKSTGAKVTLWDATGNAIASSFTNGFGEAIFEDLQSGNYAISLEHAQLEGYVASFEVRQGNENIKSISTKPIGSLRVNVRDAHGNPVNSRDVWATTSTGMTRFSRTDASGVARFESIAGGDVVVDVEGAPSVRTSIAIATLNVVEVNIP